MKPVSHRFWPVQIKPLFYAKVSLAKAKRALCNMALQKYFPQIAIAVEFLLQLGMSWLCALSRHGVGAGAAAGAGCWCWCCDLAVCTLRTGCRCWVVVLVLVL